MRAGWPRPSAAALVAPREVVVSDVAAGDDRDRRRPGRALGLDNVRARTLDLEEIDEPDGGYDVVLCREGLMFAADPARARGRDGARAGARWPRGRRRLGVARAQPVARARLRRRRRPARARPCLRPGSLARSRSATPGASASLLSGAGLADVAVAELAVPLRAASFEEWWRRTRALAGPLAAIVASLPDPAARELTRPAARGDARLRDAGRARAARGQPHRVGSGVSAPWSPARDAIPSLR